MARPFLKILWFQMYSKFDFVNSYLRCSEYDFKKQGIAFKLKIKNMPVKSKSPDILSFRFFVLSGRGYFFETPGILQNENSRILDFRMTSSCKEISDPSFCFSGGIPQTLPINQT